MTASTGLFQQLKGLIRKTGWYSNLRKNRYAQVARGLRAYPDWRSIIGSDWAAWERARDAANGPKILMATNAGLHFSAASIDSLIAVALTLRGARVDIALCDAALPACMMSDHSRFTSIKAFADHGPQQNLCHACQFPSRRMFEALGLPIRKLSAYRPADYAQTPASVLSEHVQAGTLRFFARESLEGEAHVPQVQARYEDAAAQTYGMAQNLFARHGYDAAVIHHGIYVPQGLFAKAAHDAGARVVTWHTAYRERSCIYSHGDTYHRTMLTEPTDAWEHLRLTDAQRRDILAYLHSRRDGSHDWISFQRGHQQAFEAVAAELGLDRSKPIILALSSVSWDAKLHYHDSAFATQQEWILSTIEHFAARPELQLVIRIHPAELLGSPPSRQFLADIIRARYPKLPANVFVLGPEHKANSYALAEHADSALIYSTKMGIELASLGIPVVVAGEAWIRGKGFSSDASSAEQYQTILQSLPLGKRMDEASHERALRYAYHFFLRRMIPINALDPQNRWPLCHIGARGLASLMPGADPGLDIICDGILKGEPFIYKAEAA